MEEVKELQTLATTKGVYNSFPDKTAREQLGGKLSNPGGLKVGDYLRVQSIGADGTVVLEGADGTGGGDSGQNPTYELPVGGDELGGVKNGGNVVINEDGTMTAPESEVTDEQVQTAVSDWLDEHPEATTTVADGSITPAKTTFMDENSTEVWNANDVVRRNIVVRANGTYAIHGWLNNNTLSLDVSGLRKLIVRAFSSYINWLQTATEIVDNGVAVISNGYTTDKPDDINATDVPTAEMREVEIDIADGASFIMIDLGKTLPTYVSVCIPNGVYRLNKTVDISPNVAKWVHEHPDDVVADGSITTEKLADDAITPEKIDGIDVTDRFVQWKMLYDGTNTSGGGLYPDENSAIYVAHLEKGKTYCVLNVPNPLPANVMPNASYEDNRIAGLFFVYSSEITKAEIDDVNGYPAANRVVSGIMTGILEGMHSDGYAECTADYDWTTTYACNYLTMLKDVWLYQATLKPRDGMMLNHNNYVICEAEPGYTGAGHDINFSGEAYSVFQYDLGNSSKLDPVQVGAAMMAKTVKTTKDRVYAAMSRDVPRDRSIRIAFIGDSITYAGSNAGLQNAFRKYVSMNLNAPTTTICQSGVSVTTGSGSFDWNGGTGDNYDSGVSGYVGLSAKLPKENTIYENEIRMNETDIVIVELGTNDFWEGAALGSVSDLTDDTTFYGAVEKTIALLESTYPNAQIMWVLPFKNEKWTTANGAGNTLVDYLIALKILCQTHERVWVLDLFDKWYLDYDNAGVRSKFFIDGVHISGNAHKCVAEAMIDKIRQIVSVCGLKRIEQPEFYSGNDSRYGAT